MAHLENKLDWCLRKARKEGEKHRGLKEVKPDMEKANKHIVKADHNLKAMLYLIKGNFPDWAVSASFYARYHCLLALLAKFGYDSRNQECTFALIHYLIEEGNVDFNKTLLNKIASIEPKNNEETSVDIRERYQYGTEFKMDEELYNQIVKDAKEVIEITREIIGK